MGQIQPTHWFWMFGELITHIELQTEGQETNKCHTWDLRLFLCAAPFFLSSPQQLEKDSLVHFMCCIPANLSIRPKSMLESTNQTNLAPPAPLNSAEICWRLTGTRIIRYTAQNFWFDYTLCVYIHISVCFCMAGREGITGLWGLWMFWGRGNWLYLLPLLRSCDRVCPEGDCHVTIDPLDRLLPWLQDALMN